VLLLPLDQPLNYTCGCSGWTRGESGAVRTPVIRKNALRMTRYTKLHFFGLRTEKNVSFGGQRGKPL